MDRLTAHSEKNGIAYLVKVKPDEQEVDSRYPNTLRCIMDSFNRLAAYEDTTLTPAEITAMQDELARYKAAEQWISVSERLPDPMKKVLCKWAHDKAWHEGIVIGYYTGKRWFFPEMSMSHWSDVTHWMPLPVPPKGGESI